MTPLPMMSQINNDTHAYDVPRLKWHTGLWCPTLKMTHMPMMSYVNNDIKAYDVPR